MAFIVFGDVNGTWVGFLGFACGKGAQYSR